MLTRRYGRTGSTSNPPQTCVSEIPGNCPLSDGYEYANISFTPESTALVLVDVWNTTDPVLLDSYSTRLLPLLAAARKAGLLIVHAPSQGPLLSSIHVLPGELLVVGEDGRANSSSRCVAVSFFIHIIVKEAYVVPCALVTIPRLLATTGVTTCSGAPPAPTAQKLHISFSQDTTQIYA